tara:strand:+ start:2436 stop:3797 length:1362 start_codon:yes stop_codon:yes gene_type:complete
MKHLLTNAFHCAAAGHVWAGLWAHPDSRAKDYNRLDFWLAVAQVCESGLLDGIFLADILAVPDVYQGKPDAMLRSGSYVPSIDPMFLVPAMAAVTKNISFGITGNTTYETPFLLARRFSTLDHLTEGRVAWNVVCGIVDAAARLMGRDRDSGHDRRYEMSDDFAELAYKLWEGSWDDEAAVRDAAQHCFADPSRIRPIEHDGPFLSCHGINTCEPSPQRTPLIYSAGASQAGLDFVGRHAECAFISYGSSSGAAAAVRQIREKAVSFGRAPDDIKVFVPATVVVAQSDAEANEICQEIVRYIDGEGNLANRSALTGVDLSKFGPDDRLAVPKNTNASQSGAKALMEAEGGLCIRDLMTFGPGRDLFLVGSPSTIADKLARIVENTDIDGLNLARTIEPKMLGNFCNLLVPELQNRGMFKTGYAEGPIRQKLFPHSGGRVLPSHPAARHRFQQT